MKVALIIFTCFIYAIGAENSLDLNLYDHVDDVPSEWADLIRDKRDANGMLPKHIQHALDNGNHGFGHDDKFINTKIPTTKNSFMVSRYECRCNKKCTDADGRRGIGLMWARQSRFITTNCDANKDYKCFCYKNLIPYSSHKLGCKPCQ